MATLVHIVQLNSQYGVKSSKDDTKNKSGLQGVHI